LKEAEAPTGGWWDDAPAPAPEKTAQTTLEKSQEPVAEPIPAVEAAAVAAAVVSSLEGVESTDWEGIYAHRAGRATLWVVLQPQGAFHQKPPVKVDSFGPAPATWRVENDRLLVKWSEEKEDIATISRSEHGILLDGNECRRVDHDFSGFALDGHWKGDTGEYDFDPDGKFSTTDGADGKYELGNRAITLVWNEGGSERLSFMCERVPGERAMVLYIAGEAFRRVE